MKHIDENMMQANKARNILCVVLCLFSFQLKAEIWQFHDNFIALAVAHETKTADEQYEGSKLIFKGQTIFKQEGGEIPEESSCCVKSLRPVYLYGLMDAQLKWGVDGTALEFVSVNFTPWAVKSLPMLYTSKNLHTQWELLELGATRYISDDALELESYLELSILRVGRMLAYNWSKQSPFTVYMGMQASTGWALAKSTNSLYSTVSNPFAGIFLNLSIMHNRWGKIYTHYRFVNGFSISNPSRGHPTAREALVRLGYENKFNENLKIDFYGEKRSFYFDEGGLPGLYTPSGIFAAQLSYLWK